MLSGAPEGELDQLAPYCPTPKTGCCQCGDQRLTGWDCVGRNLHPAGGGGGGWERVGRVLPRDSVEKGEKRLVIGGVAHLRCLFTWEDFILFYLGRFHF